MIWMRDIIKGSQNAKLFDLSKRILLPLTEMRKYVGKARGGKEGILRAHFWKSVRCDYKVRCQKDI